jgi:hypothetical protein
MIEIPGLRPDTDRATTIQYSCSNGHAQRPAVIGSVEVSEVHG